MLKCLRWIYRLLAFALLGLSLFAAPAIAFDTMWHAAETAAATQKLGCSADAANVMKLGNFAPDLFGPVEDYAAGHLDPIARKGLQSFGVKHADSRAAAVFLHFDNLGDELNTNARFDYIFTNLLQNTQAAIIEYDGKPGLNPATRNTLVLETLGASLHAVQDFYSHSDWIHQNFDSTSAKLVRGQPPRAPTWFEARERLGDPAHWPFIVKSGIYPPIAGMANTHTHMNHDNSRLIYREEETPDRPLVSQAPYHRAGALPAEPGNQAAIYAHQQLAVTTAEAASDEWIKKIEEDPATRRAIESAKSWRIRDVTLSRELQAGLVLEKSLSCAAGRWDGEDLPPSEGALCRALNEKAAPLIGGSETSADSDEPRWKEQLEGLAGGLAASVAFPSAVQYSGEFWEVHSEYRILDHLSRGFSSREGRYEFATQ